MSLSLSGNLIFWWNIKEIPAYKVSEEIVLLLFNFGAQL
jgi:hypothetical protein